MNMSPPDPHEVVVHDLGGLFTAQREKMGITLEKAGFELIKGWGPGGEDIEAGWKQRKWNDESWILGVYYPYVKKYGIRLIFLSITNHHLFSLSG